jgi:hypothetical protein
MKKKISGLLIILSLACFLSCDDEKSITDPVYEFVAFSGDESVDLNEAGNSTDAHPAVIQLYVFEAFAQDVTVNFTVTPTNVVAGTDFTVTPSNSVTIKAGKFVSDTLWIKTVNNGDANELPRSVKVAITGISQGDLKIGLGLTDPKKGSVVFNILDDECSGNPICIFNTELMNAIGNGANNPAAASVDKLNSKITVVGEIAGYSPLEVATLTMTLTPDGPGSATGKVTFDEQEIGTDTDGYLYKVIQVGEGTYNATTGTISIEYEVWYMDGGWVYWYTQTNEYSVP